MEGKHAVSRWTGENLCPGVRHTENRFFNLSDQARAATLCFIFLSDILQGCASLLFRPVFVPDFVPHLISIQAAPYLDVNIDLHESIPDVTVLVSPSQS
jgi:hypothetical protein